MIKLFFKVNDYSRIINFALLILRLSIGVLMLTHGVPKLVRLLDGNLKFSDPIGIGSTASLILTVFSEVICSVLIFLGLGTRLASIPLIITMIVIIFIVHGNNPLLSQINLLLYLLGYIALLISGSGKYSLDYLLQRKSTR
jgi:putative oxidoreductase